MKLSSAVLFVLMLSPAPSAEKFDPGPASSYSTRQTNDHVTVAAVPYTTGEQVHAAFGKHDPNQYGILPVLVIVQNDLDEPLRVSALQAEFEQADGRHIESVPAADLPSTVAKLPKEGPNGPGPKLPFPLPKKKNPLAGWELDGRAFTAQMIAPHEAASGFFYFETRLLPGARLYLPGMQGMRTGKGIIYFEIPLEQPPAAPR